MTEPQPLPPPPPPGDPAPATAAEPSALQTLAHEGNKLVLRGKGLQRFVHLPVHCAFRQEAAGVVTVVLVSQSLGPVVSTLSATDGASLAVLDALPYRADMVVAEAALARHAQAALPPEARAAVSAIPEHEGSVRFDGHVLAVTLGDETRYHLPDDAARPALVSRSTDDEGRLRLELDLGGRARARLVVAPEDRDTTERGLLFLRKPDATKRPTRWEYRVVKNMLASSFEEQLNAMGRDGWELVAITGLDNVVSLTGNKLFAVMKRAVR